jgi:hypothetical protein
VKQKSRKHYLTLSAGTRKDVEHGRFATDIGVGMDVVVPDAFGTGLLRALTGSEQEFGRYSVTPQSGDSTPHT